LGREPVIRVAAVATPRDEPAARETKVPSREPA